MELEGKGTGQKEVVEGKRVNYNVGLTNIVMTRVGVQIPRGECVVYLESGDPIPSHWIGCQRVLRDAIRSGVGLFLAYEDDHLRFYQSAAPLDFFLP